MGKALERFLRMAGRGTVDAEHKELLLAVLGELKGMRADLGGFAKSAGMMAGKTLQRVETLEHDVKILKTKPGRVKPKLVAR